MPTVGLLSWGEPAAGPAWSRPSTRPMARDRDDSWSPRETCAHPAPSVCPLGRVDTSALRKLGVWEGRAGPSLPRSEGFMCFMKTAPPRTVRALSPKGPHARLWDHIAPRCHQPGGPSPLSGHRPRQSCPFCVQLWVSSGQGLGRPLLRPQLRPQSGLSQENARSQRSKHGRGDSPGLNCASAAHSLLEPGRRCATLQQDGDTAHLP